MRLWDEQAAVRAIKRQVVYQVEHDACVGGETVGGYIGHALCAAVVAVGAVTGVSSAQNQRKVVGGAETGGEIAADLPPGAVLRDGLGKRCRLRVGTRAGKIGRRWEWRWG